MDILQKVDAYQAVINERRPFEGALLNQIRDYYRIGLTWSSNALEGNTLTESETKVLIEDGLTAGGKPLVDSNEAVGHARAYDFMFSLIQGETIKNTDILMLHRLFYEMVDPEQAGIYREVPVIITGSNYPVPEPEAIADEMQQLEEWINQNCHVYHPVVFAALIHMKFVFVHPFVDGNGRVARLLMNLVLLQQSCLLAIIPPILRSEYIALLEKAHTDESRFIEFIAERVLETQKDMARLLHIELPS